MIGKTIGNYKIISGIGRGGMGVVYLAEHINLGRRVAIKCLAPRFTLNEQLHERFCQEARNQARLQHPNIVQVTDFFEQDGLFFLVMEYVDGCGLDELIKKQGRLSEKQALPIFKQVLEGLNFAHSKGIIHRDVKPSNILIDKNSRADIMDFGISVQTGDRRLTITGTEVGTACYMSPEQITRPKNIDHRSDVYSAGIILYEMLTGDVPFDSDTDSDYEIKEKHCRLEVPDPIQRNPLISKQLAELILKALEKNPDNRFNGCGEFLEYIRAYEKEERVQPSVPDGKKRKTGIAILISLFIVCGIGFGYYLIDKTEQKPSSVVETHRKEEERLKALAQDAERERLALEEKRNQAKADIEKSQRLAQDVERKRLELEQERKRQESEAHERLEQERKRKEEERLAQEAERKRQEEERERLEQEGKRKEEERLAQETERKQSPVEFIRYYYEDLNRHDVNSASGKWKKPPSKLRGMIENIEWFKVNYLNLENENSDSACVRVDVTGKVSDKKSEERWVGTIDLEKVDGEWKIVKLNLVRG